MRLYGTVANAYQFELEIYFFPWVATNCSRWNQKFNRISYMLEWPMGFHLILLALASAVRIISVAAKKCVYCAYKAMASANLGIFTGKLAFSLKRGKFNEAGNSNFGHCCEFNFGHAFPCMEYLYLIPLYSLTIHLCGTLSEWLIYNDLLPECACWHNLSFLKIYTIQRLLDVLHRALILQSVCRISNITKSFQPIWHRQMRIV